MIEETKAPAPITPGVTAKIQTIKSAPPPADLPILGKVELDEISFIGRTNYVAALEEKKFIFGIKRQDRERHLYVIGKNGVGKTKLLELLMRQDIEFNHGFCLLDPHGDLINDVIAAIPERRIDDVCLIDPADVDFPISFNPLADVDPVFRHQLTQGLVEVMEKQFGTNWTPRIEHVFRFTVLALLDYPGATMRGMISMLTEPDYRKVVAEHVQDELVKRFWSVDFADWSARFDSDAIIPLVNKLGQFLSDPMLRNIFGQPEGKIDLRELMNAGKIVLINLNNGRLGEENANFFGALFLTKIKQAGMERARMPEAERKDFYLYLDEFHHVATHTFEHILSEARKYGLSLTLAHQYIGQLPAKVLSAVLGTVASIIAFRVGGADAAVLEDEFAPVFKVKDMINLGKREFYIKMMIDGESYDPFSAETLKVLPPTHRNFKDRIIEASRRRYAISTDKSQSSAGA